jgi:hypothetical protein
MLRQAQQTPVVIEIKPLRGYHSTLAPLSVGLCFDKLSKRPRLLRLNRFAAQAAYIFRTFLIMLHHLLYFFAFNLAQ